MAQEPYYDAPQSYSHNQYPMHEMGSEPTLAANDDYKTGYGNKSRQHGSYQHLESNEDAMPLAPTMAAAQPLAPPPLLTTRRRTCCDKLCCGCCTCFPRWLRSLCCVLFLIIVALAIVVGVLAAIFKVPTVSFNGIQGEPQLTVNGTSANFLFNLNITIDNPNVESITFEKVVATAYYPGHPEPTIGGGQLDNVHIARYALTQITFPFTLSLDSKNNATQAILLDLMGKCGLTGGAAGDVKVNYNIVPTLSVVGIKISPTISNSASLPCNSNDIPNLSSITSLVPSPTAV